MVITDSCSFHGSCYENPSAYNNYRCTCDEGYTGEFCEEDIDDCEMSADSVHHPCYGHGTCIDRLNGYRCQCDEDFYGESHIRLSSLEFMCIHNIMCKSVLCWVKFTPYWYYSSGFNFLALLPIWQFWASLDSRIVNVSLLPSGDLCENQYLPCEHVQHPCGPESRAECVDLVGRDNYRCICLPPYIGKR